MSLSVKSFSNGEVIIKEGDSGKSIFRLVEGNADVYSDFETKDPFRLAVLKAGDYFGEIFRNTPEVQPLLPEAMSESWRLPRTSLMSSCRRTPM